MTLPKSAAIASGRNVAIVGGGPAGLMAAEVLSQAGVRVDLYDGMPSVGRKFLLAGVGGMNITHSEAYPAFLSRYAERAPQIAPLLREFGAEALCQWIHGLGIDTFVGSSGRVFPTDMKAAPLLRAWLKRLRDAGVVIHTRHRWLGWNADGSLRIQHPEGESAVTADATLLALGGGSWSRLGSDGAWLPLLQQRGVQVAPLQPSNCGFEVSAWSELLRSKFAGAPLKNVAIGLNDDIPRLGECVITASGIEGSLIYAVSAHLRDGLLERGDAHFVLDLLPDKSLAQVLAEVQKPRGSRSWSSHLKVRLGLQGVKMGLIHELCPAEIWAEPLALAQAIKGLKVALKAPRPMAEAISTAGGVAEQALTPELMLRQLPGVFCAGEMLDWEAPTGGYLLTACLASGKRAAEGILGWK